MIAHDSERRRGRILGPLLFDHPRQVGESYVEHAAIAGRFGLKMVAGGIKCLIHALLPGFHVRAASDAVHALHGELEQRRRVAADTTDPDYVI